MLGALLQGQRVQTAEIRAVDTSIAVAVISLTKLKISKMR